MSTWYSPYDDRTVTDPSRADVDHVPLAEAWRSGASEWSLEQREAFAGSDRESGHHLIAKGDTTQEKQEACGHEFRHHISDDHSGLGHSTAIRR